MNAKNAIYNKKRENRASCWARKRTQRWNRALFIFFDIL